MDAPTDIAITQKHGRVAQLLPLGNVTSDDREAWPDYATRFGFRAEHAPALIELAVDPTLNGLQEDVAEIWAPIHAIRALGELRIEEAIQPLLGLLRDFRHDDAITMEVPRALGMIGAAALRPLEAVVAAAKTNEDRAALVIEAIGHIGEYHPEQRDICVSVLSGFLGHYADRDDELNAWIICSLLDLKAVEAVDIIRAAFDADRVDMGIVGDLEDVEIDLGVREKRTTPKPRYNFWPVEPRGLLSSAPRRAPKPAWQPAPVRTEPKVGRNAPCPCGSGKKYKKCCAA